VVHGVREIQSRCGKGREVWLWPGSRMAGWRAMMLAAGLEACTPRPRGRSTDSGGSGHHRRFPLNFVQKWLGHAQLSPTAVYSNAVGREEKDCLESIGLSGVVPA
jgi:integrase/recombinase XerD